MLTKLVTQMRRMLETISTKPFSYLRDFRVLAEKENVIKGAERTKTHAQL